MQFNRTLRYIVLAGLFLVPIISFVVTSSLFFPFITGKNLLFRVLVEVMVGAWIVLAVRDASFRLRKSWVLWAFVAFIAVIGVADLFGVNPEKSFWSNFERMEGYVTLLHLLGYTFVLMSVMKSEKLWERLMQVMVSASVVMSINALMPLFGDEALRRVSGTFGNATYLAIYMLFHIFLVLVLLARHKGYPFVRWLYWGALVLQIVSLYYTVTRGAIIGLLGGLILTALLVVLTDKRKTDDGKRSFVWRASVVGIVIAVIAVGSFIALRDSKLVQGTVGLRRLASISLDQKTVSSRFLVWGMAWDGFKERPVLGWGQENFNIVFNKNYRPEMLEQEQWFDRAHNVIFDWLTAGGILGLLTYLSIIVALVFGIWSRRSRLGNTEKAVLTGLIAGYLFHNLFVFDNIVSYILFMTIIAYVHTNWVSADSNQQGVLIHKGLVQITPILVLILTAYFVYAFTIPGAIASRTLLDGLRQQEGGFEENMKFFDNALALDTYGNQEIREQLLLTSQKLLALQDTPADIRQLFFERARDEMQKQIDESPGDARNHLFQGAFLSGAGQFDLAIEHLEEALVLSPRKQTILMELSRAHFGKGDTEEGLRFAKDAYDLSPQFLGVQRYYAISAIRAGQKETAKRILVSAYGTALVPHNDIINAYASVGALEEVAELWKLRLEGDPHELQAYVSYAATLVRMGDIEAAVAQIEEAIIQNPDFETIGNGLIDDIRAGRLQ